MDGPQDCFLKNFLPQNCVETPNEEEEALMRQELLAKMRQRKDANKERTEKKVKTVSTTGDREAPYDLEKVLKELGEVSLQKSIFY